MKLFYVLRALIGGLIFSVMTVLLSILTIISVMTLGHRNFESWIIHFWSQCALWIFGVKLEVKGLENIPEGSGLFLFNHSSFFDIFAMAAAFDDFRFGAKVELFKIPFFGEAMRRAGVLPIARQNREEVFKVYAEARSRTEKGEKFALAPEGGRNYDGKLLPFKAGPFIFAINSQIRIIPTVIQGAHAIMRKGSYLPNADKFLRQIRISYLPPIDTAGFTIEDRQILQEKAFSAMKQYIDANPL